MCKTAASAILGLALCVSSVAAGGKDDALAAAIVKESGWSRGICVDLSSDPALAVELAKSSDLSVYRIEADAAGVARTRKLVEDAGLSPLRMRVESGPLAGLEYPDWCANLIIADSLGAEDLLRLLRPAGGVAYLRQVGPLDKGFESTKGPSGFTRLRRGRLDGTADWTHYHYDPSNNRYSPDANIREPLRVLWYGEPTRTRGELWLGQGLAAGGRLFLADRSPNDLSRSYLTAVDAYNGTILWEREVGSPRFSWERGTKADSLGDYMRICTTGKVLPGQMAICGDRIYLADSPRCLVLDAVTGKDLASFATPPPISPENHWTYLAVIGDTLFGSAAAPDARDKLWWKSSGNATKGGPGGVFALEAASGKPRWVRGGKDGDELGTSPGVPLAIDDGRILLRSGADLFALDAGTGKTAWLQRGVEQAGEETWWEGVIHGGKFYLYMFNIRLYGSKKSRPTLVFATADGHHLEEEQKDGQPLYLSSDKQLNRLPSGSVQGRPNATGCAYETAAGGLVFGRSGYWREGGRGGRIAYGNGAYRAACKVGALPANGLVHMLPNYGCRCVPFSANISLQPGKEDEKLDPKAPCPLESSGTLQVGADQPATAADWPAYRADPARTTTTTQSISAPMKNHWEARIPGEPTPPVAVGDLVYVGSTDERVYALEAGTGKTRWAFASSGPVQSSPAYWNGRLYFGSGDGWVYCLAAADGRLLWRLQAATGGRKQVGFGRIVSVRPVRQGLAVEGGKVYFTAGLVPSQGILTGCANAVTGKLLWRTQVRDCYPSDSLVLGDDRVFIPTQVSSRLLQLARSDGAPLKAGMDISYFIDMACIAGAPADAQANRNGFLVHGGGGSIRGYGQELLLSGNRYNIYPAPWSGEPQSRSSAANFTSFADGFSFPPVFGKSKVYFRQYGRLVAVDRGKLAEMQAVRERVPTDRNRFFRWVGEEPPCGPPQWLVLAGADDDPAATLLAGGPKGVAAFDASTGKVRWSVNLAGPTLSPAVARGQVLLASPDGRVCCLAATP
jgi:outer membrane protein assembly factor BamB